MCNNLDPMHPDCPVANGRGECIDCSAITDVDEIGRCEQCAAIDYFAGLYADLREDAFYIQNVLEHLKPEYHDEAKKHFSILMKNALASKVIERVSNG